MRKLQINILPALVCMVMVRQISSQLCKKFDQTQQYCIDCSEGAHLYKQNCLINIPNCISYLNGFDCQTCQKDYVVVDVQRSGYISKRCKRKQEYQVVQIDIKSAAYQNKLGQIYLIATDYVHSFYQQLKQAKAIHAQLKKYPNKTQIIQIEYQPKQNASNNDIIYKVGLKVDMQNYIFHVVQFSKINKNQLRKQPNAQQEDKKQKMRRIAQQNLQRIAQKYGQNQTKQKQKQKQDLRQNNQLIEQKNLNLFSIEAQKILVEANKIANGQKYKGLASVKTKSYKNGSQYTQLQYLKQNGLKQPVIVDIKSRKIISINGALIDQVVDIKKQQSNSKQIQNKNTTVIIKQHSVQTSNTSNKTLNELPKNQTKQKQIQNSSQITKKSKVSEVQSTLDLSQTKNQSKKTNQTQVIQKGKKQFKENPNISTQNISTATQLVKQKKITKQKQQNNNTILKQNPNNKQNITNLSNASSKNNSNASNVSTTNTTVSSINKNSSQIKQDSATKQTSSQTTVFKPSPIVGYTAQNNKQNLLKDLYFVVSKDFLNKQIQGYTQLLPTGCYIQMLNKTRIFLMIFNKPDGSQTQVKININLLTYRTQIQYQHLLKLPDKLAQSESESVRDDGYDLITQQEGLRNVYFIIAVDYVQKLKSDYKDANISRIQINNKTNKNIVYFKIKFLLPDKYLQITSSVSKKSFTPKIQNETETTFPKNNQPILSQPTTSIAAANLGNRTQKQITNNSSQNKTQRKNQTIQNSNRTQSQISQSNAKIQKLIEQKNIPNKVVQPIEQTRPQAPKTKVEVSSTKQQQKPAINANKPSSTQSQTQPQPQANPNKALPSQSQTLSKQLTQENQKQNQSMVMHPQILAQALGFTQLTSEQISRDKGVKRIDDMLRNSEKNQLSQTSILTAFSQRKGIIFSYKIFYLKNNGNVIEAFANYDILGNKVYILSLFPLIQKSQ